MIRWAAFLLVPLDAAFAEWPQFRGPNGAGVAEVAHLPVHFGPGKNVFWRTELLPGHSSPVISGDRIFVTAAAPGKLTDAGRQKVIDPGGKLYTICLDRRTGKILWQREVPRPRLEQYQATNSPASPSPVTDGRSVYVFFGDFGLVSYRLDGKERWRLPLGPFNNMNGHGSSPILVDDLLVVLCDQDTDSYLLAVDKETGRVRWKTARPESTRSYSTPAVLRPKEGPVELIVPGSYQLTSYDARTGEKLWWITGMSWQPKSTPIIDGEIIYAHWWESGGEVGAADPDARPLPKRLPASTPMVTRSSSAEEFASEPGLQKGFYSIDLGSDGIVDERDWNFYRARRGSRNALVAVRHGRPRRSDRKRQRFVEPAEVSPQLSFAAALSRSHVPDQGRRDSHQPRPEHRTDSQAGASSRRARHLLCLAGGRRRLRLRREPERQDDRAQGRWTMGNSRAERFPGGVLCHSCYRG